MVSIIAATVNSGETVSNILKLVFLIFKTKNIKAGKFHPAG
jgi:hypothetical protein